MALSKNIGIYTRTVIPSPVVRWYLLARIRDVDRVDLISVGSEYVQIHEICEDGHLKLISTHEHFGSRIRAATVIDNRRRDHDDADEDLIKREPLFPDHSLDDSPIQSVVLTLDSNKLVSFFLRRVDANTFAFTSRTIPLPIFSNPLLQLGEHVAADSRSRAVAVAASEGELALCAANGQEYSDEDMQIDDQPPPNGICIILRQTQRVEGTIQHMAFLTALSDDDDNHVFLLLITTDDNARTRAVVIDWHLENGVPSAQAHKGLVLDAFRTVPSLLIPLRNAAFALVVGGSILIWKNILSGSVAFSTFALPEVPPAYPGNSPLAPLWVSWARSRSNPTLERGTDLIYLMREDGILVAVRLDAQFLCSSIYIGNVGCQVSPAFACDSTLVERDILIVGGDMSDGRVVVVNRWALEPALGGVGEIVPDDLGIRMTLPNWASMTDTLVRSGNKVFVTSGRQPFGTVTELRRGIQARLYGYFEMAGLRSVTGIWAVQESLQGDLLIFLAGPDETRILRVTATFDAVEELDEDGVFDTTRRTILAGLTDERCMVQVTAQGISARRAGPPSDDIVKNNFTCEEQTYIIAASLLPRDGAIITAETSADKYFLAFYKISPSPVAQGNDSNEMISRFVLTEVVIRPLSLSAKQLEFGALLFVATEDCSVFLYKLASHDQLQDGRLDIVATLPAFGLSSLCDHMAIVEAVPDPGTSTLLLVICGLRDGKIATFCISPDATEITKMRQHVYSLGSSTVKLYQSNVNGDTLVALVDNEAYILRWDARKSDTLLIDSLWISDPSRPELVQESIIACVQNPNLVMTEEYFEEGELLGRRTDAFILLSGDEFLLALLDTVVSTVPRRIPLSGTPNRLIYAEKQRCLVSASLCTGVRSFPSPSPHTPPQEKRQIWPAIDFIPIKNETASCFTYRMQPGERVYALVEWSFRHAADKTYSFILSAGSYTKSDGVTVRGRVRFLQPMNKNWEVTDVKEGHSIKFEHPVFALALFDRITFVVASGRYIYVYRFSADDKKWDQVCPRYTLGSAAHFLTVEDDLSASDKLIVASTSQDSLVTFRLREAPTQNDDPAPVPQPAYYLEATSAGTQAQSNLAHVRAVETPSSFDHDLIVTTTRLGQVYGFALPQPLSPPSMPPPADPRDSMQFLSLNPTALRSSRIVFTANLPRSLTRIRTTTPSTHRVAPHPLISSTHLTGISADGAMTRLVLLPSILVQRLAWLQRLCAIVENAMIDTTPALPSPSHRLRHETLHSPVTANTTAQSHIDGDILSRVCALPDAEERLRETFASLVQDQDQSMQFSEDEGAMADMVDRTAEIGELLTLVRGLDGWVA